MSASTESTFRASLNTLGWTRRSSDPDVSTTKPSLFQRLNPFSSSGYIRLPTSTQDLPPQLPAQPQQESAGWFVLSHWERLIAFICCVLGAAVCFIIAFMFLPFLVTRPRKFVVLWTVGSILFLCRYVFI
jgi:Got1/Sft2-like family